MTTLQIPNFLERNLYELSVLTSDAAIGTTTINLQNTHGIANGDYLLFGAPGSEGAEIKQATATPPSATSATIAATTLKHYDGEHVCKLFGNKIRIYRAPNVDGTEPADAAFSILATVDVDFDQTDTIVEDVAGSSSYWYKFTYYNSTSLAETDRTLSSAVRGGEYGNYCTLQAIREKGSLTNNRYISNYTIDTYRQAAQDEVNGALVGIYTIPFSPVPPRIADITARIAANLLLSNYPSTMTAAERALKAVRAELTEIQVKASTIVVNGQSIAAESVGGFSMFPDASTDGADPADGGPMFTASERY